MDHLWDLGVQKYQVKKSIAELGRSDLYAIYFDPNKIYVDPNIYVYSNGFFFEISAPMLLKFHMRHDQSTELQNEKIQFGYESKMVASA